MRFGWLTLGQSPSGDADYAAIHEQVTQACFAETAGFDGIWLTEHNFTGESVYCDPIPFASVVAARTSRIRLGFAVIQLALRHPIRLATQLALLDNLSGGRLDVNLPLTYRYDHAAARAFASRIQAAIDRPAQKATVTPESSGALSQTPSRNGVSVNARQLTTRIDYALGHPNLRQTIVAPARWVQPAVTSAQLAARYPSYIVINRGTFTLRLYRHLTLSNSYPIAVGRQGLETPAGLWHIQWMQVNPPWYVPNDSWAGSLAGTVVPPGPKDPLKARFMSFNGGAGIHGIDPSEYGSIGHTASHGCVRMTIPDVIDLYGKVRVGTPVYII